MKRNCDEVSQLEKLLCWFINIGHLILFIEYYIKLERKKPVLRSENEAFVEEFNMFQMLKKTQTESKELFSAKSGNQEYIINMFPDES